MNERIRQLAEQARVDGDAIHYYSPLFAEKFAELILAECADILDNKILPPSHPMNSIGYRLKDHFGVEG